MTPPNPFIHAAQDPVGFFAAVGYLLLMVMLAIAGTAFAIREATALRALASREHRQRDWWGEYAQGWLPPSQWSYRAGRVVFVLALTAWALSALSWFLGG